MTATPAPVDEAPPLERTLSRLFLTLFLRGRVARGLNKKGAKGAPATVARKLWMVLAFYAAFGASALVFAEQPLFALALYLHAMTFVMVGMFVAASAGEVLFNQQDADILLHRPVPARTLLWAKVAVMVRVSLWLAGAFNIAGLLISLTARGGNWRFLPAHAASTVLVALFCTGCVVLVYQLCLRWFGRERLDSLMTATQVVVSIAVVAGGQIVPQLIIRAGDSMSVRTDAWWIAVVPPAWFASFDNVIASGGTRTSFAMAAVAVAATALVLWLAFGKLAGDYERGLQTMSEGGARAVRVGRGRFISRLAGYAPVRLWLRDPVSRASFQLSLAYLVRDRDVKLRIYPGIAPAFVMPIIFMLPRHGSASLSGPIFGIAFGACYLALIPMSALQMLEYSQQWQATDLFRVAPTRGPAALCAGARSAVLVVFAIPAMMLFAGMALVMSGKLANLALLAPGVLAMPVYTLIPCLDGRAVPLSRAAEDAKGAGRSALVIAVTFAALALGGIATWAWLTGWFGWLLAAEALAAAGLYIGLRMVAKAAVWWPIE